MDALELLTDDHNKVRELFKQFNGGGGLTGAVRRGFGSVSSAEKSEVAEDICRELEVHTQIEKEIFYPAVQALGIRQVREALEQHKTVKNDVAALPDALAGGADLQDLMDHVEHCVEPARRGTRSLRALRRT